MFLLLFNWNRTGCSYCPLTEHSKQYLMSQYKQSWLNLVHFNFFIVLLICWIRYNNCYIFLFYVFKLQNLETMQVSTMTEGKKRFESVDFSHQIDGHLVTSWNQTFLFFSFLLTFISFFFFNEFLSTGTAVHGQHGTEAACWTYIPLLQEIQIPLCHLQAHIG